MQAPLDMIKVWLQAIRIHTLSAAAVPVLVGSALAGTTGRFDWTLFALTLVGSVLVQIGANLTDEYADHEATASAEKFMAPHKVIKRGVLSVGAVRVGALVVFAVATAIGAWLVWVTGWPLLVVCLVSLLVAWAYSAGPLPLGDYALGEVLVFIVMGPVMVVATAYVQTGLFHREALWLSLPVAALVTAILVINNLRDEAEDRAHGRQTLTTVFGPRRTRGLYIALIVLAYLVPLISVALQFRSPWLLVPWFTLPQAVMLLRTVWRSDAQPVMHFALRATAALHLLFGAGLAVGLLGDYALGHA